MLDPDIDQCHLRTAQYVHEIVVTLSRWAAANNLDGLARSLHLAAIEAADTYHQQFAAYRQTCATRKPAAPDWRQGELYPAALPFKAS